MEQWLPVVGYEDRYEVSDEGRVRAKATMLPDRNGRMKPQRTKEKVFTPSIRGYSMVMLNGGGRKPKNCLVHALVMAAFVGPRPEGYVIRHLNHVKTDNRLANLAYGTPEENRQDSYRDGKMFTGQKHHWGKLTTRQIAEIQMRYAAGGHTFTSLARLYGTSITYTSEIARGVSGRQRELITVHKPKKG